MCFIKLLQQQQQQSCWSCSAWLVFTLPTGRKLLLPYSYFIVQSELNSYVSDIWSNKFSQRFDVLSDVLRVYWRLWHLSNPLNANMDNKKLEVMQSISKPTVDFINCIHTRTYVKSTQTVDTQMYALNCLLAFNIWTETYQSININNCFSNLNIWYPQTWIFDKLLVIWQNSI